MKPSTNRASRNSELSQFASDASQANPWYALLGVVVICVVSYIVYRPALNGEFVLDDELLTQDKLIKASDGLYRLWFTTEPADYWPVTSSSFWFEWRFFRGNPTGYHITNLVLHIVDCLLLWLLLKKLEIPGSFLAALIFAVHPVNVESVAWIAQRKNLLALLFFLLSALTFFTADRKLTSADDKKHQASAWPWYLLSLLLFVFAMLSKGSVAVLPALLLLVIWWRRPLTKWDLARTLPFFVIGGLLVVLNVWFQTHGSAAIVRHVTPLDRLLGAGAVVWFYLFKALLPINLTFVYPQWNIQTGDILWWLPLVAAICATVALFWPRNNPVTRPFFVAWAFFCLALVPVMGFTDVGYMQFTLVADHYQHIALIGLVALVAAGVAHLHKTLLGTNRILLDAAVIGVIACLILLSIQLSSLYTDPATLYRTTLEKNPNCWLAYNNLGNYYRNINDYPKSAEQYNRSLEIKPDQAEVYGMLGVVQAETGQSEQALANFQKAIEIDPKIADVESNWGVALKKMGRLKEAGEHLRRAMEIKPDNPVYYNNLGQLYLETGQPEAAVKLLEIAHQLDPTEVNICAGLAIAYGRAGHAAEAIATGHKALQLARLQRQKSIEQKIDDWLTAFERTNSSSSGSKTP